METNNKLREALEELRDIVHNAFWSKDGAVKGDILNALRRANIALSAPPRNCDTMNWRDAWEKWRLEAHPATPATYKECYESSAAFMDWYTSAKGETK